LSAESLPPLLPPGPSLWFDAATCSILRKSKRVPLTKREYALLTLLVEAPNRIHRTSDLADRLTSLDAPFPVDEHSVEQAISLLRRKLGESGKRQRILRTHHGIGYGLFPQKADEFAQPPTLQPRQSKARTRPKNVKKT
jgi:DNA-binding response OmpR family regulator